MSKYQDSLISYIKSNPDFIRPEGKKSEVLGFLKQPLGDLCISRPKSRLQWGVELPFDSDYVTYVWFDALLNYTSAVGLYQSGERGELFDKFWKEAIHLIGKDILITHSVYWPTMLMALEIPLPKGIFAHGWWLTADSKKMSKSEGPVVTPLSMKDIVGVDPLRYYFIRDARLGNDSQFSTELVINRINAELANNLGNLFSRSVNLICKYFNGKIPNFTPNSIETKELADKATACAPEVKSKILAFDPSGALEVIIQLLHSTNQYLDRREPWKLAKTDLSHAGESLRTALECVRISATLLSPVMPQKMIELLTQIGWERTPTFSDTLKFDQLSSEVTLAKPAPLFPRVDSL
ncbi:MAG: class I tRNA ligase family protein, partial [Bdellovibrionales bacterium]|nr:class I tRNA ligase family protein [Bdellovibrionales bacterium]